MTDTQVMQVVAVVMAERLAVGTDLIDRLGQRLGVDVSSTGNPMRPTSRSSRTARWWAPCSPRLSARRAADSYLTEPERRKRRSSARRLRGRAAPRSTSGRRATWHSRGGPTPDGPPSLSRPPPREGRARPSNFVPPRGARRNVEPPAPTRRRITGRRLSACALANDTPWNQASICRSSASSKSSASRSRARFAAATWSRSTAANRGRGHRRAEAHLHARSGAAGGRPLGRLRRDLAGRPRLTARSRPRARSAGAQAVPPARPGPACRLGVGKVEVLVEPVPWRPRRDPKRRSRIVEEHRRRQGDPAAGGSTRQPIMTAYRQQALACAAALSQAPARPRDLKGGMPDAPKILLQERLWLVREGRARCLYAVGGRQGGAWCGGKRICPLSIARASWRRRCRQHHERPTLDEPAHCASLISHNLRAAASS